MNDFFSGFMSYCKNVYNKMTSIIESCFEPRVRKIHKETKQETFQQFLKATALQLKHGLIKLSQQNYCITFTSRTYEKKIKYFTILDMFDSHSNIKIIPLDSYGQIIRSRQNFNKNGWIRKHINQNKNKFLKVNPLSGEVCFIYSCFVPERMNFTKFWNELIQKIAQIQKEMPFLLSKIINLEGKQKPLNQVDQLIETNKLVNTIKLAQMMKQNLKIEDQFNKINSEFKDSHKLTSGLKQKFMLNKYTINQKQAEDFTSTKMTLQKIFNDYSFHSKLLDQNSFRVGKSNLTSLTLTKQDQDRLKAKLRFMNFREETRWKIQQFNREMFIIVKKEDNDTVKKVKKLLRELGDDVEYLFLDNFLDQEIFDDIILTVALKQIPLMDFISKNFLTISYETKFRLLIQAFNSISTLWLKNNISFESLNIQSFTVTKNIQVKMKKLEFAKYIHPCRLENQEAFVINSQRRQIFKEFSNIYFDIFFNRKGASIRAQKLRIKNQPQYRHEDLIFESLNELTKFYYPNNLFTLIIGLNYFFIEMYRQNLSKPTNVSKLRQNPLDGGVFKTQEELRMEHVRRLSEAKKGGPRIDLILAMCIQFLEEHESKDPERGGEM